MYVCMCVCVCACKDQRVLTLPGYPVTYPKIASPFTCRRYTICLKSAVVSWKFEQVLVAE